jgi:hypothetical protein
MFIVYWSGVLVVLPDLTWSAVVSDRTNNLRAPGSTGEALSVRSRRMMRSPVWVVTSAGGADSDGSGINGLPAWLLRDGRVGRRCAGAEIARVMPSPTVPNTVVAL